MSEFTAGYLYLNKDTVKANAALEALQPDYKAKQLNDQWTVICPEEDNPNAEPLRSWLLEHSSTFPILYFEYPEDHGWGYDIYRDGQIVASLWASFELKHNVYVEVVKQRFPGINPYVGIDKDVADAIRQEVVKSDLYRQRAAAQFVNTDVEQFAIFGFDAETVAELQAILKVENYLDPSTFLDQVYEFKRLVNIQQMNWVNYRYLVLDD